MVGASIGKGKYRYILTIAVIIQGWFFYYFEFYLFPSPSEAFLSSYDIFLAFLRLEAHSELS